MRSSQTPARGNLFAERGTRKKTLLVREEAAASSETEGGGVCSYTAAPGRASRSLHASWWGFCTRLSHPRPQCWRRVLGADGL